MSVAGEPRVVEDPAELAALFERDRACHLYGLGDLSAPLWPAATWWRRGDAVVGVVPLPASDEVAFYAISPRARAATLALLTEVHDAIPPGAVGGGPVGLAAALAPHRALDDLGLRVKMVVDRGALRVPPPPRGDELVVLGPEHHAEVVRLHATEPDAVFFVRSMWEPGHLVGARTTDGTLVATAGTHVLDEHHRVAAIGAVFTHPSHRGRGLADATTAAVAAHLLAQGLTVGLNVGEQNDGARRVYDRLGFRTVHRYEEARLR